MFKRFGIPALALAAAMAVAAPTVTLADGRDGRGHGNDRPAEHVNRGYENRGYENRGYERHDEHFERGFRGDDGRGYDRGFNVGVGVYAAPAPVPANGYYDQYGVWHPYGYYDQYGVYHSYGY